MPARLRYDSDSRRLGEMFLQTGIYLLTDVQETDISSLVARKATSNVEQLQAESEFFCLSEHRTAHGDCLAECVCLQASTADMETEQFIVMKGHWNRFISPHTDDVQVPLFSPSQECGDFVRLNSVLTAEIADSLN